MLKVVVETIRHAESVVCYFVFRMCSFFVTSKLNLNTLVELEF